MYTLGWTHPAIAPSVSRRGFKLILLAAGAVCVGVAVLVVGRFDPAVSGWYPPCPFHALTGLYCPGCGSTRAIHQFLHGHLLAALRLNALAVLALPFLACWAVGELWRLAGHRPPSLGVPGGVARGLALGIIAFAVLRNVPAWPFTWLAP